MRSASTGRKALRKDEKGQALIEFTLTAPLILLALIGAVFFAWVMYDYVVLQQAVREGAHYGVTDAITIHEDDGVEAYKEAIVDRVKEHLGLLNPDEVDVLVEGAIVTGGWVEVTAYYNIRITEVTVPYIITAGSYTFPPIKIRAVSSMYLEGG